MTANALTYFEPNLLKYINENDGNVKSITITIDDIIGNKTKQYIDTLLAYIASKQGLDVDKPSTLNKLKELLKESNIKCVLDAPMGTLNIQLGKSIFNFDNSKTKYKPIKRLRKSIKDLQAIDLSYCDELNNNKLFMLGQLNDKLTELINQPKDPIEQFYMNSLALTLIKYLK